MRTPKFLIAALTAILMAIPATAMASTTDGADVTVVHGVPGLTVDVWANGEPLLEAFEPGTVTDPVSLPAGSYDIEIYPAGTDPEGNDPAIADTVEVTDGLNASVVAHLDADGAPTLSVFVNDTSEVATGEARLTVRHTAAFGAVDILAGGDPIFEGVTNPNEGTVDVPAGSYDVAVTAAGDPDTVAAEVAGFELAEGANTIVYAIGDPAADPATFELLVQSITGLHSSPEGVPSGEAGMATDSTVPALTAAGLLLLAGAAIGLRRRATDTV